MIEKKSKEEYISEFNRLHNAFVSGEDGFVSGEDESAFKYRYKRKSTKPKRKRCKCK